MIPSSALPDLPDLGERVYEVIRADIVSGALPPGTPLLSVELARRLGVSRTPVNEAIARLSEEGLVERVPRRGFYVANSVMEDMIDLRQALLMLELIAARFGVEMAKPAEIFELRRRLAGMEELVDEQGECLDYARFATADSEFHHLLVKTAGNHHLVKVRDQLAVHFHVYRMSPLSRPVWSGAANMAGHRAILAALEQRNLAALERALIEHTDHVLSHMRMTPGTPSGI